MAITYDAPSNTITVVGAGFDLDDIFDADVLGGWGVFSRQGGHQYLCEAHLEIGDDSTLTDLTDDNVHLQIGVSGANKRLMVLANATLTIGKLHNGSYDTDYGLQGNSLILYFQTDYPGYYVNSMGDINLYGVSIWITPGIHFRVLGSIDFRNVIQSGNGNIFYRNLSASKIYRSTIATQSTYGFMCYTGNIDIQDLNIENRAVGINCGYGGFPVIAKDCYLNDSMAQQMKLSTDVHFAIYDCNYDIYKIYTQITGSELDDYKGFKLRVETELGVAIQGATVTITDAFGTDIIETTDINGDITKQDLHNLYCTNKGVAPGLGTAFNDYTFYTPYTIKIEKAGYWEQEYMLDLLRDDHKKGVNHTVSLIPLSDFLAVPIEVSVDSPNISVQVESPEITVEVNL